MQDTRSTTEQSIDSTPGAQQQCAGQKQGYASPFELSYVKDVAAQPERQSGSVEQAFREISTIAPQPYSKADPKDVRDKHKFGRGFVPGLFEKGKPRQTPYMLAMTAIVLDIDDGMTVEDGIDKMKAAGLCAQLYTSANHLQDGKTHKFRLIFPTVEPYTKAEHGKRFEQGWKDIVAEFANRHGFAPIDTSKTAPNSLFFFSRPPDDLFDEALRPRQDGPLVRWQDYLTPHTSRKKANGHANGKQTHTTASGTTQFFMVTDPQTGQPMPLVQWAARYSKRFKITDAIKAAIMAGTWPIGASGELWQEGDPEPELRDGKQDILCPNHAEHTGDRSATVAVNPQDRAQANMDNEGDGFLITCLHAHCADLDRLDLLQQAIKAGWIDASMFGDRQYYTGEFFDGWKTDAAPELVPTDYGDALQWFDERFFIMQGKVGNIAEATAGRCRLVVRSVEDFQRTYSRRVELEIKGEKKPVHTAASWIKRGNHTGYEGAGMWEVGTEPCGYLNLWNGFPVQPDPTKPFGLYMDHLCEIICAGHDESFHYLVAWLAHKVQNPLQQSETAIVIIGSKGVGKSMAVNVVMDMFGPAGMVTARHDGLTKQFNDHLENCVIVHAEEALFAGDHRQQSQIKSMITDPFLNIERKFGAVMTVDNHLSFIFTSNDDKVVAITTDERRFLTLHASDKHARDFEYFKALNAEIEAGAAQGLLDHLQKLDLAAHCRDNNVNLRSPPWTKLQTEQAEKNLPAELAWLFEMIETGAPYRFKGWGDYDVKREGLVWPDDDEQFWSTPLLYAGYEAFFDKSGEHRSNRMSMAIFGRFIKSLPGTRPERWSPGKTAARFVTTDDAAVGEDKNSDGWRLRKSPRPRGYWFPPRPKFKKMVIEYLGKNSGFAKAVSDYQGDD